MDTIGPARREPNVQPASVRDGAGADPTLDAGPPLRQILRLIEDQGHIGFWWQDADSDEIEISAGLARIVGWAPDARPTRASMMEAIHPSDRRFQDDQAQLVDLGQPLRREFRIVRADGTLRWVSCRIDVVVDGHGFPVRFIGVLVDITERREALRRAEYNQERRLALVEALGPRTWFADARGESHEFKTLSRVAGRATDDVRGEEGAGAIHPDDRDRVLVRYRAAIRDGGVYDASYRIMTAMGTYERVLSRAAPVRDRSGAVLEWQGVTLPAGGASPAGAEAPGPALTGVQIRGARGLLGWSLAQLAAASGVSVSTIKRMEDGSENSTRPSKVGAVRRALETAGVAFRTIDGATWISR